MDQGRRLQTRLKTVKQERDTANDREAFCYKQLKKVEKEGDTAKAQLKMVEEECNDEREEHERVLIGLRIALQAAEQERDTAKAKLKTVEQERDDANERVKLAIAEWARLEKAAYGTPGLGGI